MKRIAFLILSVLLTVSVFAQDPGATEKNAGNAAVKAKNYPEAFKQYEAYLIMQLSIIRLTVLLK